MRSETMRELRWLVAEVQDETTRTALFAILRTVRELAEAHFEDTTLGGYSHNRYP